MRLSQGVRQSYCHADVCVRMTRTEPADVDLLIDLLHRSPLLEVLDGEALDRRDLQERLGISRSTCHRHTRLLRDHGVVERHDGAFRLTESGQLLADAMGRFKREATSALELAPLLAALETAPVDIDRDAFLGATVTSAERGDPYSPVARFVELTRETSTLRGMDMDVVAPLYLEEIQRRIVAGMDTEDIARPDAARNALDDYPEKCMEACLSGHLTIKLRGNLPFALAIFDDRVGVGVVEPGTRSLRLFVDTDDPAVREWAEAIYAAYDDDAVVLEEYTAEGFRAAMEARGSVG